MFCKIWASMVRCIKSLHKCTSAPLQDLPSTYSSSLPHTGVASNLNTTLNTITGMRPRCLFSICQPFQTLQSAKVSTAWPVLTLHRRRTYRPIRTLRTPNASIGITTTSLLIIRKSFSLLCIMRSWNQDIWLLPAHSGYVCTPALPSPTRSAYPGLRNTYFPSVLFYPHQITPQCVA